MNTKSPLVQHVLSLSKQRFAILQQQLDVMYTQGHHESDKDFRIRVLTVVDKAGNMRVIEALLND